MRLAAGQTIAPTFFVFSTSTSGLVNADSTPTVVLKRNASVDGAVTVTVSPVVAGEYTAQFTVPGGYAVGDYIELVATKVVSGVTAKEVIFRAVVDVTTNSRMATFTLPANFASLLIDVTGQVTVGTIASAALTAIRGEMESAGNILDTLKTRTTGLTSTLIGYLANLNVGGLVASQADINAINQSASRRITLAVVPSMERPESGSNTYTVELRLWTADGVLVNADSAPVATASGRVTGSLSGNISGMTNPLVGVYRWTYTVASNATLEEVRIDVSALVSTEALQASTLSQVADFVAATFTAADRTDIQAAKAAALAAQARAELGIPSSAPGTASGLPLKSDLPAAPDNAGIATAAAQATIAATQSSAVATILTGITRLSNWLRLLGRKSVGDATALSEFNTGGGTFDPTTDSGEAIRERGDAAWLTGGGGGGGSLTAEEVVVAMEAEGTKLDLLTKSAGGR